MATDAQIEQMIQTKGLTAPRVTPADVEVAIVSETYFTAAEGQLGAYWNNNDRYVGDMPCGLTSTALPLLTFCVLTLDNGFTVTGESACASPENFDAELGRKIARQNAVAKVWPLLGFRLRDKLLAQGKRSELRSTYRERALELARNAAIPHTGDHSYIPDDVDDFYPHEWVISAIVSALMES